MVTFAVENPCFSMKNIEQIIRYTSQCEFPENDWQLVLSYCRTNFVGGKIHKALKPKYKSTYKQFIEWIDNGFGSGDIVRYGHTSGILSTSVPDAMILGAYCDYEGNLITKELEVFPGKVLPLEEKPKQEFKELLFNSGFDFSVKNGKLVELYIPKKFSYASFTRQNNPSINVGLYIESRDYKYRFSALLLNGELLIDCEIEQQCTPLRAATLKEIQALHNKASKEGWVLEGRTNTFTQKQTRNYKGKYWYITYRFTVIADKDMGDGKHDERYEVGNYFIDETEAVLFANEIITKRKEGQ